MKRTLVIALVIFALVAATVPMNDSSARWRGRNSIGRSPHSKRTYRSRRALLQRRRAAARRRRARLMRRMQMANAINRSGRNRLAFANNPYGSQQPSAALNHNHLLWTVPANWSRAAGSSETKWNVRAADGRVVGAAVLRAVSVAENQNASSMSRTRLKPIGGVPITTLRRTVIDRMVASGGWVINDWVREIGGRRVYIVSAQTGRPADPAAAAQAWSFYFVELDNHIYNLVTNAAPEFGDLLAGDTEMLVASLRVNGNGGAQTAMSAK
ncbi:MAG: hypothetical protein M3430_11685 [Acidobacteriota bacterium]|nr:hypothetical protein [Acidobacteriota bacterium]